MITFQRWKKGLDPDAFLHSHALEGPGGMTRRTATPKGKWEVGEGQAGRGSHTQGLTFVLEWYTLTG